MSINVLKMYIRERLDDAAIDEGDPQVDELVADMKNGLAEIPRLQEDSEFLSCLKAAGVDNWGGYSDAIGMMEEDD